MQSRDFRQLEVWQLAHQLTLRVYKVSIDLPDDERYGLTSQIRRAAVSIPNNIAEGCGRGGQKELARFMRISRGSASEVEYLVQLAHELGYLEREKAAELYRLITRIGKMLTNFIYQLDQPESSTVL